MKETQSLSFSGFEHRRALLPSRPKPLRELRKQEALGSEKATTKAVQQQQQEKRLLDAERLIGTTRVGGSVSISPDGTIAVFEVKKYDFDSKKFDEQLWLADLTKIPATTADPPSSSYLQKLTSGSQYGWTSANTPKFSPCGKYIVFLSNRKDKKKTSVWTLPVRGPGEATLLKEFPLSVGDLEWSHEVNGIIVSSSVYVDNNDDDDSTKEKEDVMKSTATRDEKIASDEENGGLNAVLFKRLPIREWDRWLDAKMAHPFFLPVVPAGDDDDTGGYKASDLDTPAVDLLRGLPTSVPSGAFGGSDDWTISKEGHVAVSARPPIAEDEAWTTNRHIYLCKNRIKMSSSATTSTTLKEDDIECLTLDNPGFDYNPVFSPDGTKLAWLSMKGKQYEADAVSIRIYDLVTQKTTTLLEGETDWDYSPNSLRWSRSQDIIFFTADVKSRQALCSIDVASKEIRIIKGNQSTTLHGEIPLMDQEEKGNNGHLFLASIQSLTNPTELYLIDTTDTGGDLEQKNFSQQQLTHFNTEMIAQTALGEPEEFFYKGENDDEVQAWLIRPANFNPKTKYPLAVIYHGGPQGSSGDDWHYRWNLQFYASQGFAVLAPNFHGSTGFGHEFCRNISQNWKVGGTDTMDGVNALLSEFPWIDSSKVVGLGASYGGFTSNWLNGNAPKDMFKALVCHCGTFDLKSSYYATEELFFMETEFGGPAYSPEASKDSSSYKAFTPSAKIDNWNTPTLVIHGAKDFRLVESEGISTFTALQRRGVPSEMLYLPTENHHCLNPQNSMVWHETVLRWMKTWTK